MLPSGAHLYLPMSSSLSNWGAMSWVSGTQHQIVRVALIVPHLPISQVLSFLTLHKAP